MPGSYPVLKWTHSGLQRPDRLPINSYSIFFTLFGFFTLFPFCIRPCDILGCMLHSVLWLSYSKRVYLVRGFRPLRTFIFNRRLRDSAGYFRLHLKDSKTDPFHRFVFLGSSGRPICAVTALPLYLGIRGSSHGPPALHVPKLVSVVAVASQFLASFNCRYWYLRNYSSHSFRIDATTAAVQAGIPDHLDGEDQGVVDQVTPFYGTFVPHRICSSPLPSS